MPVPTARSDLNIVAANNSPPGTESAKGNIDNYLRAHASLIAQNYADIQTITTLLTGVAGTDTITGSATPDLTSSYAAGQCFRFVAAGANTGAVTLNIDGMGAKAVTKNGTTALAAGDIPSGSVCEVVYDGTQFQLVGVVADRVRRSGDTMTGPLNAAATSTVASATTTDIGAATSNSVIISGATTITGLGTIAAGAVRDVTFSGALTLTHNATSLILPGAANIATVAGDTASFLSLGSGNWRCLSYQRADGKQLQPLTLGTVQATTSGAAVTFSGIPNWARRITLSLNAVSTSGTNEVQIRLGTSGGIQSTGYLGTASTLTSAGTLANNLSTGFDLPTNGGGAAYTRSGIITFTLLDSANGIWSCSGLVGQSDSARMSLVAGVKQLSGTLTQVQIVAGGDSFDNGSVNILYE